MHAPISFQSFAQFTRHTGRLSMAVYFVCL